MASKAEAVRRWAISCPAVGKYLRMHATEMKSGARSLSIESSDADVREFIDGTREKQLTFALAFVEPWSEGMDSLNASAMQAGEEWLAWVDAQFSEDNVPDFGPGCTIRDVRSLQTSPALAAVFEEDMLAKYTFQAQITYWEALNG